MRINVYLKLDVKTIRYLWAEKYLPYCRFYTFVHFSQGHSRANMFNIYLKYRIDISFWNTIRITVSTSEL